MRNFGRSSEPSGETPDGARGTRAFPQFTSSAMSFVGCRHCEAQCRVRMLRLQSRPEFILNMLFKHLNFGVQLLAFLDCVFVSGEVNDTAPIEAFPLGMPRGLNFAAD